MASLIIEIIGWIGMIMILLAYILLEADKIEEDTIMYNGLNLVGAGTLAVNTISNVAYPAAGLNIAWIFIAVYGILRGKKIIK